MSSQSIIFTDESMRCVLEGKKTQTRRIIQPQPKDARCSVLTSKGAALFFKGTTPESPSCDEPIPTCRYGQAGSQVWVRETYALADIYDKDNGNKGQLPETVQGTSIWYKAGGGKSFKSSKHGRWRTPWFMPRWASRMTLEITEVRVERLHAITEEDARAEGAEPTCGYYCDESVGHVDDHFIPDYQKTWESLQGKKYPWASNPWVWVISFKKI